MFERFTDRARRMIVLAQAEAQRLDHASIGTEHMLLGLLEDGESLAAQALAACDVQLDAARAEVERIVGRGAVTPSGHIPFTARAKKVLERALREALQLGHNYIGTEHILLGLLAEEDGVAIEVLVALEAEPVQVRAEVLQLVRQLATSGPPATVEPGEGTVFVVPGGAVERRNEVVQAVHDLTGRPPVVLQRRPHARTGIVELFEEHGGHPRAAVVVLAGDDVGGPGTTDAEGAEPAELRPRARQDVLYELGWFHGRLGRYGVVVLVEEGVETAGDIGVPYVTLDTEGTWRDRLAAGLSAAGLRTDPDPGSPT